MIQILYIQQWVLVTLNKCFFLHLAEIHVNTAARCPPVTKYLQTLTWMTVEEMSVVSRALIYILITELVIYNRKVLFHSTFL